MDSSSKPDTTYIEFLINAIGQLGGAPDEKIDKYISDLSQYETIYEWTLKSMLREATCNQKSRIRNYCGIGEDSSVEQRHLIITKLIQAEIYI